MKTSRLLIDTLFVNWGAGGLYPFYVLLCSCLTHFSEKCVKMKPKYRLPTQTLAASVTLGCDRAQLQTDWADT